MRVRRRRHRLQLNDRGSAALEMAFVAPVFLLLVFFGIQVGLWAYGRSVALAAAREGVAQLRVVPDPQVAAQADPVVRRHVEQFATTIGRESLLDPRAVTAWSADQSSVTVTVTGHVISLVPGLDLSTTQHAAGTLERFGSAR
ncbi:TadE/TadG family type IV pilus assembly protein [Kineococcus rhizosphaerae]|uniref:TadE-like protein n=1 Tax=Kineococcus rhizosphaerae TaxID=559628 RepID=A0A2T0R9G3_9ACTN|nr:TadE/TadG family type IV pilus assembly protein [Kineococcus rhizosphaerae]PRY17793.1 TadE-like protein [Kineococcus rhizosphaerae]